MRKCGLLMNRRAVMKSLCMNGKAKRSAIPVARIYPMTSSDTEKDIPSTAKTLAIAARITRCKQVQRQSLCRKKDIWNANWSERLDIIER